MQSIPKSNPLANYMRQPKIHIKLPTGGVFWPPKSIEMTETGDFPVYSMTAKDELTFKTPDALLNGQAMVDVIQSCMPNIKNAWVIPTLDLDSILIAIRLATYGDKMTIAYKVPVVLEEVEFEIDLRHLLDQQLTTKSWEEQIHISDDLIIFVKPLTYKHMSQASMKAFETQRIMNMAVDDTIPEDKKLEMFNKSFSILTQITVDLISESISKIIAGEHEVTDPKYIKEFMANADKDLFDQIKNHLDKLKTHNELKPLVAYTTEEQQAEGAPVSYEIPINFNNSDFFA
jgi:hypothetical protein